MSFMDAPTSDLHADYETTAMKLQQDIRNLAQTRAARHEARIETWFTAPADTAKERDLIADRAAMSFTRAEYLCAAEVEASRARLDLIDHILAFRNL